MISVFEKALAVLHANGLSSQKASWTTGVRASSDLYVHEYQGLTQPDRAEIDYSKPTAQAAYLYSYAMPRAYFTLEMLRLHRAAIGKPLFAGSELKVVSFGGGPASELIGLLAYLDNAKNEESISSITYRILDKDIEWADAADAVIASAETGIQVNSVYEKINFSDALACSTVDLSGVDLVIFSYIMSELCSLPGCDQIADNIRKMVSSMCPGARMLFIDSRHPTFIRYFQQARQFVGRQQNDEGVDLVLPLPPFGEHFELYRSLTDRDPRMDASIISKWLVR